MHTNILTHSEHITHTHCQTHTLNTQHTQHKYPLLPGEAVLKPVPPPETELTDICFQPTHTYAQTDASSFWHKNTQNYTNHNEKYKQSPTLTSPPFQYTVRMLVGGKVWGKDDGDSVWRTNKCFFSPAAMEELDGDEVRVSSRGRFAERDIVQVISLFYCSNIVAILAPFK